jgi:hypothetical protein
MGTPPAQLPQVWGLACVAAFVAIACREISAARVSMSSEDMGVNGSALPAASAPAFWLNAL